MNESSLLGEKKQEVPAGVLPPWTVGDLPPAPSFSWRSWTALLGPGVLLAGASIGSGEWLAGPGVTAQYGATLLWVATFSIVAQVFCNLEFMRYALYCGEPSMVGAFRTKPGPKLWTPVYALLEFGNIWPFNVASASVAVTAIFLGHLPRADDKLFVHILSCVLFLLAYTPLIFGGTVYKTLERIMTTKLVVVLVFLCFVATFLISNRTMREVFSGFVGFGQLPLRASTIIDGRHFTLAEKGDDDAIYSVSGTVEESGTIVTRFVAANEVYDTDADVPEDLKVRKQQLVARAEQLVGSERFYVEQVVGATTLAATGTKDPSDGSWQFEEAIVTDQRQRATYQRLDDIPDQAWRTRLEELISHRGLHRVQLVSYIRENGRLPDLDWAMIATFASIAGAGGLSNVLLSNYARDKGWGMGAHVGAIGSAVGGRTVSLSHVGQVFRPTEKNMTRWRGWIRHIVRDQAVIWMICCFIGMALPCMMSVEFIRNAPVSGLRVAGMTADGIEHRFPGYGLGIMTLLIGFLILYPGQILSCDTVPRRWCDIIWTASPRARRLDEHGVRKIYYGLMFLLAVWGLLVLIFLEPLAILKIGGVLMNFGLGAAALHAIVVNCTLLPPEVRPNWFMRIGVVCSSVFFFTISGIVLFTLW
ncbi:MAG: Nramp family divalent metal transporter [Pirellulaceae bacterium]|nr:Nramp family divalent metal transporter [Pirellulaceae bacterium]